MKFLLPWGVRLLALVLLGLCLFSEYLLRQSAGLAGGLMRELQAVFRDAGTQWIVAVCLVVYIGTFMLLRNSFPHERSWKSLGRYLAKSPDGWLLILLVLVLLTYSRAYENVSRSFDTLTLLGTIALGQAIGFWNWQHCRLKSPGWRPGVFVGFALVALLTAAALCRSQPDGVEYAYLGRDRWTGPWSNPNTFGVLTGAGVVLGCGLLAWSVRQVRSGWRRWALALPLGSAIACLANALLHSYSRGAWLSTALGLSFLLWKVSRTASQRIEPDKIPASAPNPLRSLRSLLLKTLLSQNLALAVLLAASVLVLIVLNSRASEHPVARRLASIGNVDDFSWRNRVTAWKGALQMMAERPWLGHGSRPPERLYEQYYKPAEISESAAIQLNDYLNLGAGFGLPALAALLICIGLRLRETAMCPPESGGCLDAAFAATALMLCVAFWFDGGLFKLSAATLFWICICTSGRNVLHNVPNNISVPPVAAEVTRL